MVTNLWKGRSNRLFWKERQVAQDSTVVLACVNDTMQRLHNEYGVRVAYIRSDNAGAYKSARMLTGIQALNSELPITIKRWDFSESQDGKGPADTTASAVKRRVRAYVDSNHKATNAMELAIAAHSDNGVRGVTTVVVRDVTAEKQVHYVVPKVPGIQSLFNFKFEATSITAWKAYNIGTGKTITINNNNVGEKIWLTGDENGVLKSAESDFISLQRSEKEHCQNNVVDEEITPDDDAPNDLSDRSCFQLFSCHDEACTKTFTNLQNLMNHIAVGKHSYIREVETLTDCAMKRYNEYAIDRETQEALARIPDSVDRFVNNEEMGERLAMGFALKKASPRKQFNDVQRRYLTRKFNDGEKNKSKFDPREVAAEMRHTFPPDQCLSWQQVASYFSVLSRKKRGDLIENDNNDVAFDSDDRPLQVAEDIYISDPNLGTVDDVVAEEVNRILKNN